MKDFTFKTHWTMEKCIYKMNEDVDTREFRESICNRLMNILGLFQYTEVDVSGPNTLWHGEPVTITFTNVTTNIINIALDIMHEINDYMSRNFHGTDAYTWFLRLWHPFSIMNFKRIGVAVNGTVQV